jgi:hypothetical protein
MSGRYKRPIRLAPKRAGILIPFSFNPARCTGKSDRGEIGLMKHEQTILASCEGFGNISSCSCGLYHIRMPGISVHLRQKGYNRLMQMIFKAKKNQDSYGITNAKPKKNHLKLVTK